MTAVPWAIDALLNALQTAPGMSRVKILDGPWIDRPSEQDVIAVGWLGEDGEATVEFNSDIAGLDSTRETFDLLGRVSSWRGGTLMKPVRDAADALIETVRDVLAADRTLGGAVTRARLVTLSLREYQTTQGAVADFDFAVHVDAFRLR